MKKLAVVVCSVFVLFLAVGPMSVKAAASVTPGSTTTIMGMPVTQVFKGLTASTAYDLILTTGTNQTLADGVVSDSDGELSVTVSTFDGYGQNAYVLQLDSGSAAAVVQFNIENMDVIPYVLPMIILSVLITVVASIRKGLR